MVQVGSWDNFSHFSDTGAALPFLNSLRGKEVKLRVTLLVSLHVQTSRWSEAIELGEKILPSFKRFHGEKVENQNPNSMLILLVCPLGNMETNL